MISTLPKINLLKAILTSCTLCIILNGHAQESETEQGISYYLQPSFGILLATADGKGNGGANVEILSGHKAGMMFFIQGDSPVRFGVGGTYIRQSFGFNNVWFTGENSPFQNGSIYNKVRQNTTYFGIPLEIQFGNFRSTDWKRHSFYASLAYTPAFHGGTHLDVAYNEAQTSFEERTTMNNIINDNIADNISYLEFGIGGALLLGENQKTGLGGKITYLYSFNSINEHFIANHSGIKAEASLTFQLN